MKKKLQKYIPLAVTFVFIIVSAIITKQNPFMVLPLCVSLFIMAFQADVNRYAYIAGGINSIYYTVIYVYLGVYATAASAVFSCVIQFATFINWQKHSYKRSVNLKRMSNKTRATVTAICLAVWVAVFAVLSFVGSPYAILDNTSSIIGTLVSILTLLAYIEYSCLWIASGVLNILLNAQLAFNNPKQITFLIFSFYSFYCIVLAFINVRKLYKEQKELSNS